MKKFFLSGFVIFVFILYVLHERYGLLADDRVSVTPNISVPTTEPLVSPTPSPIVSSGGSPVPTLVPTPTPTGRYKDGQYTGSVADAFYGNIQVKAIISGGAITDVQFLQYPSDRSTSVEINSQAMPLLKQEAIQAQSAQVSGVSGATASSGAFIESLTNALQQAK